MLRTYGIVDVLGILLAVHPSLATSNQTGVLRLFLYGWPK